MSAPETSEMLAIIQEEQTSPVPSIQLQEDETLEGTEPCCTCCLHEHYQINQNAVSGGSVGRRDTISVDQIVKEKEIQLRAEYDKLLEKKISLARERFNFVLQNEQLRACYMLREAHRERQEKITALESQLECKNLTNMMYVMCTERTKSKLEKLRLIEDYTNYINGLQDLLKEAQEIILHLSRGYKTAARVDYEWREKMTSIVGELMKFIVNFAGGPDENNQYFLDLPNLMKIEASVVEDPKEDPCEPEETEELEEEFALEEAEDTMEKRWWDMLEDECKPFVVYGDMAEFKPPQRRQVIRAVKAAKIAPQIWKKYVFNEMLLHRSCDNTDDIKNTYPHLKQNSKISQRTASATLDNSNPLGYSKLSLPSRRVTAQSLDGKTGDMSSLLKIITSTSAQPPKSADKSALLGARDSIEIHSSTRVKQSVAKRNSKENVVLEIGKKYAIGVLGDEIGDEECDIGEKEDGKYIDMDTSLRCGLGSLHHDSLDVIPTHKPDKDHIIGYERICPVDKCQRLQVDSFMRSLPPYMRASPFSQFQTTYEDYETCSPEQLEMLKQRLEAKKSAQIPHAATIAQDPEEWVENGVGTQTSTTAAAPVEGEAPCTCADKDLRSPADSKYVFDLNNLIPIKLALSTIKKECFYDDTINFDRFKVIGQNKDHIFNLPMNCNGHWQVAVELLKDIFIAARDLTGGLK